MTDPITPAQADAVACVPLPQSIVNVFNELITETLGTSCSSAISSLLVFDRLKMHGIDPEHAAHQGWLDIAPTYRAAGWEVEYYLAGSHPHKYILRPSSTMSPAPTAAGGPLSPAQARAATIASIPDELFSAFNELLLDRIGYGVRALIYRSDLPDTQLSAHWETLIDAYEAAGWNVKRGEDQATLARAKAPQTNLRRMRMGAFPYTPPALPPSLPGPCYMPL